MEAYEDHLDEHHRERHAASAGADEGHARIAFLEEEVGPGLRKPVIGLHQFVPLLICT